MFDLFPTHPITGLQALGFTKRGNPIWPVMGGSQPHGDPGTPPAGDPAPAPTPDPAAQPTPTPPADGEPDRGFPAQTPVKDMKPEEQAAYWRFYERKKSDVLKEYGDITPQQAKEYRDAVNEARRSELQPSERALEDARTQATATARQEADQRWAGLMTETIVGQFVEDPQQRESVLAGLNPMVFMTDGQFDKDKLIGHMTGLAAAFGAAGDGKQPRQWGQGGDRPPAPSARDEGLAEARRRGFIT